MRLAVRQAYVQGTGDPVYLVDDQHAGQEIESLLLCDKQSPG